MIETILLELNKIQIKILIVLSKGKSLTRNQLIESIKVSRTTIYDNLEKLLNVNLIRKFSKRIGNIGRPLVYWYIPKYINKKDIKELIK